MMDQMSLKEPLTRRRQKEADKMAATQWGSCWIHGAIVHPSLYPPFAAFHKGSEDLYL